MEEAGTFVISGRLLLDMLLLKSMCLIAISRDFFEKLLPKPELSIEVDNFPGP